MPLLLQTLLQCNAPGYCGLRAGYGCGGAPPIRGCGQCSRDDRFETVACVHCDITAETVSLPRAKTAVSDSDSQVQSHRALNNSF